MRTSIKTAPKNSTAMLARRAISRGYTTFWQEYEVRFVSLWGFSYVQLINKNMTARFHYLPKLLPKGKKKRFGNHRLVCVYLFPHLTFLKRLTNFNETWYERHSVGKHRNTTIYNSNVGIIIPLCM
jgi:hypothetical protein